MTPPILPAPILPVVYERAFRGLLWRFQPRHLNRGVDLLLRRAASASQTNESVACSFEQIYTNARERTIQYLLRRRQSRRRIQTGDRATSTARTQQQVRETLENGIVRQPLCDGPDFHCDSGLGGLARWLRAAGYDARFWPYIADQDLVNETLRCSAILLTTDEPLMERAAVTWGVIPAMLVPLEIGKHRQFDYVSQKLSLPRKRPRCMACGGELTMVDKHSVRDRIPPRTFPWIDEYYECTRCNKLFWPGTHWRNVLRQLG